MSNYIGHINATAERNINKYLKDLNVYEDIYNNKNVTEVMINTNKKIFTKNLGIGFIEKEYESDNDKLTNLLKTLATLDNKQLTENNPNISTKILLSNGQKVRVEGLIPPVVTNPTINIRKQANFVKTLESYLEDGFLTQETYDLCKSSVLNHKNILLIGGTDTGKTTFLNGLLKIIEDKNQRAIVIEDTPELQINSSNVNRVQTIPGIFPPDLALKYCMRASPERIVFGEIRDGKAGYELINGLNSGHPGGMSTIHADDGIGGLKKLEMYINSAFGKPMSEDIGMAIDLLITVKIKNYKRYLASIDICEGYDKSINRYRIKNLYLSDKENNFEKEETEKLVNYLKEKLKLDELQISILQRKSLEYLEEFILKIRS